MENNRLTSQQHGRLTGPDSFHVFKEDDMEDASYITSKKLDQIVVMQIATNESLK